MKKPNEIIMWLNSIFYIKSISIESEQTGVDTSKTSWVIEGANGEVKSFVDVDCRDYIIIKPNSRSLAELRMGYKKQAEDWIEFELKNKEELAEYERLKEKFEK